MYKLLPGSKSNGAKPGAILSVVTWLCCLFSPGPGEAQRVIDEVMKSPPPFPAHIMKPAEPRGKVLGPGLFAHTQPLFEVDVTATNTFVGTKDGNLYSRKNGGELMQELALPKEGWYWSMEGAMVSPGGKYVAAKQVDDRQVPRLKLVGNSNDDIRYKPYSKAGDPLPSEQYYVVNLQTGNTTAIDHGRANSYVHLLGWAPGDKSIRLLQSDRLLKQLNLMEADAVTGATTLLLKERSDTYLVGLNLLQGYSNRLREMNLVTFLEEKQQFSWMSDHTGTNQLYLYKKNGELVKPLTDENKNGIVARQVELDERNGWVYFLARANKQHPYEMQLFRSAIISNKIEKLVDGPEILNVFFSEAKDSLWVLRTSLPDMMQLDVYSAAGKKLTNTWKANLAPVKESGLAPEYVKVYTTDDSTMLEAFLLKPKDFNAGKKYPMVEYIYGGPHATVIPRDIFDPSMWNMQHLANAGFIVAIIDSRGTPSREKSFLDFSYGKFGQVEIKDHAAAIRQLAEKKSYIDTNRVGIIGHSWGGYFALRAVLEEPNLYKAAHLNAAAIDPIDFRVAIEPFMGCLPADCPEKYRLAANTNMLQHLKATLMINHGTADDDVPIEAAYGLVKALNDIGYNKYTFKEYVGMDHIIMRNKNWEPAMIDFFTKALK